MKETHEAKDLNDKIWDMEWFKDEELQSIKFHLNETPQGNEVLNQLDWQKKKIRDFCRSLIKHLQLLPWIWVSVWNIVDLANWVKLLLKFDNDNPTSLLITPEEIVISDENNPKKKGVFKRIMDDNDHAIEKTIQNLIQLHIEKKMKQ